LYAVGGDGLQLFDGYESGGPLVHRGRLGAKLNTGGDHDAHTIFRGPDDYIYLMAGNGSGVRDRLHITETNSPVMFEREASVFRISPDGKKWECVASGGRNPPSLGMNYLGELFSFDSDMEWHVGLPWYRPVRLNHWVIGGDQGIPQRHVDPLPPIGRHRVCRVPQEQQAGGRPGLQAADDHVQQHRVLERFGVGIAELRFDVLTMRFHRGSANAKLLRNPTYTLFSRN